MCIGDRRGSGGRERERSPFAFRTRTLSVPRRSHTVGQSMCPHLRVLVVWCRDRDVHRCATAATPSLLGSAFNRCHRVIEMVAPAPQRATAPVASWPTRFHSRAQEVHLKSERRIGDEQVPDRSVSPSALLDQACHPRRIRAFSAPYTTAYVRKRISITAAISRTFRLIRNLSVALATFFVRFIGVSFRLGRGPGWDGNPALGPLFDFMCHSC